MKHFYFVVWLCLSVLGKNYGQNFSPDFNLLDTTQVHVLETQRGDRFLGRVLKIEQTTLTFAFREVQELVFDFSEIKKVFVYNGGFESATFRPTYLSIFPTAYNYKRGEWEYQNVDLLWNTLNYGISDQLSVGAGFFIPAAFLTRVKWTQPVSEKVHLGVNLQSLFPLIEASAPLSALTLVSSIGEPDRLLNIGVGYGFIWEGGSETAFTISLGGNVRLSDRLGLNGELDLAFSEGDVYIFPSGSLCYFGKQNRLSLGFVFNSALDVLGLIGLPLVAYNQRF